MEYILMPTVTPITRAACSVLKKLMIIENPTPDEVVKTAILEDMLFERESLESWVLRLPTWVKGILLSYGGI